MKKPSTPTPAAPRAKNSTYSRLPAELVPAPPGNCTLCVASKITGYPVERIIGKERISTTKLL